MVSVIHAKRKTAIVHDVLLEYGGSERVLEAICEMYPEAPLYTFYFNSSNTDVQKAFGKRKLHTSWLQRIPYLHRLGRFFSMLKPFAWIYFFSLKIKGYELVISSSHSYSSKAVGVEAGTTHISYIHTPPRYLYTEFNELSFTKRYPWKLLLAPFFFIFRYLDKKAAQRPTHLVTSGNTVRKRIQKYYGRTAQIIPPPVQVRSLRRKKRVFFIAHSRLVKQKNIDLAVKVCTKYHLPLVVVGEGHQLPQLKKLAGNTIFFVGRVSEAVLAKLYQHAFALLYCSSDEDFGIVPLESMAFGVPVIAYREGGVTETVVEGKTGVFFDELSVNSVARSIHQFLKTQWHEGVLRSRASTFGMETFIKSITKYITEHL